MSECLSLKSYTSENGKYDYIDINVKNELEKESRELESQLKECEKIISVIFQQKDFKILYSVGCKRGNTLFNVVGKLVRKYKQLGSLYNYDYYLNGKVLNILKTLYGNEIYNGNIINVVKKIKENI